MACAQVNALKAAGIYEKTAIVFGSKHGNSPINHTALVRVNFNVRTPSLQQPQKPLFKFTCTIYSLQAS